MKEIIIVAEFILVAVESAATLLTEFIELEH